MQIVATSGLDEAHRIVDRQAGGHAAAGAVEIHVDIFIGIFFFQEQELGDDQAREMVVDRAAHEDDAILEQARINVVGAFAARRLLYDHRY